VVMHAAPTTEQRGTEGARVARGRRPARRGGAPNARLDAQLQQHQSEHRGRQVRRRVRQRERDLRCQAPSAAPAPRRVRTPVSPAMDRSTCTDQPSQQPILAPAAHGCDAGCIQWHLDTPYRSGCRRTGKNARVVHTAGSTRASAAALATPGVRSTAASQDSTDRVSLPQDRAELSYPTRLQTLSTKLCRSAGRAPHGERVRKRLPPARRRRRRRPGHRADAAAARQAEADGKQHAQRGQRHARLAEDRAHGVGARPGQRGGCLARRVRVQHRRQSVAARQHAHLRRARSSSTRRGASFKRWAFSALQHGRIAGLGGDRQEARRPICRMDLACGSARGTDHGP